VLLALCATARRSVGIRLGKGEKLEDILRSSPQVAEGVATAGVVVSLARKYRVSLPVLTAVANVCDNHLTPSEAVTAVMNLPQIEEN
jgi:glycerol-3-phosphate dehydrogenase (NAD+)